MSDINVASYGAVGDCGYAENGGSISSGSAALSVLTAIFLSTDVGKSVMVAGAGPNGGPLYATVSGFTDVRHVTLSANASTTVAYRTVVVYRTDDTAAFTAAINAASALYGGAVYVPAGVYQCSPVFSAATRRLYMTLYGCGPSSVLVPPRYKTGVTVIANIQTTVRDLKIVGGQCGIYLHSNNHGRLRDLTIIDQAFQGQTLPPPWDGDAIFVNGDDSTEVFVDGIMVNACMGNAYHYWRSTASDSGGMYLSKMSAEGNATGTRGMYLQGAGAGIGYANGTGYALGIVANPYDTTATGATGTFDVVSGSVTNVKLSGGTGYTLNPYLTFAAAGGPKVTASANIIPSGGGFGTNRSATVSTQASGVFTDGSDLAFDGYNGPSVVIHDAANVRLTNLWATGVTPGDGQVRLHNCVQMTFTNLWAQNGCTTDTSASHVRIENASHDLGFVNVILPMSAAYGFYMDGSIAANYNNQLDVASSDVEQRTVAGGYPSNGVLCNDYSQLVKS